MSTCAGLSITACFARQVARTPDAIAVAGAAARLTYAELNRGANRMAQRLIGAGVAPGDKVLVCLPRSLEAVLAFIAVLKAGAVYVPLDPGYADELKTSYLDACGARHAIVGRGGDAGLARQPGLTLIASAGALAAADGEVADIDRVHSGDQAAYVMFTSGSMGKPKGVVVAHRGVVRLVRDSNYIRIDTGDVFLLLSNISFDASTFELWGALLNGARLEVYEHGGFDPNALAALIGARQVSIVWLTAALFHVIARSYIALFAGVRVLLAGGDVLRADAVNAVLDAYPSITVVNGYGPTENTTFTCCHPMTRRNRPGREVPIGRAIAGTEVHVLDAQLRPVPDGEQGELCTSGLGVALGYLNAPAGARPAFIEHDGRALYRTGDLVRRDPDGLVHYLGRADRVTKIRGFRVSVDEVQAALAAVPGVEEAMVVIGFDLNNEKRLEAFVQAPDPRPDMAAFIKRELGKVVPPFMVPQSLTLCAQLPLNANGKLDRKSVPHQLQLERPCTT